MRESETIDGWGISSTEKIINPELIEGENYMRRWLADRNRWEYYSKNPAPVRWEDFSLVTEW